MEKTILKKNVYTYTGITESLCCVGEINTTLQINYALVEGRREGGRKREKEEKNIVWSRARSPVQDSLAFFLP